MQSPSVLAPKRAGNEKREAWDMKKPTAVAVIVVALSCAGFLYVLVTAGWAIVEHPVGAGVSRSDGVESTSFGTEVNKQIEDMKLVNEQLRREQEELAASVASLSDILTAEQGEITALLDLYGIDPSTLGMDDSPLVSPEEETEDAVAVSPICCSPHELKHFAEEHPEEASLWRDNFLRYRSAVPDHLRFCPTTNDDVDVTGVTLQEVEAINGIRVGSYITRDRIPYHLPPFGGGNPNSRHCMALIVAGSEGEEATTCLALYQRLLERFSRNESPGDLPLETLEELNGYFSSGMSEPANYVLATWYEETEMPVVRVAAADMGVFETFFGVYVCNGTVVQVLSADEPAMSTSSSLLLSIDVFLLANSRIDDLEETWDRLDKLQEQQLALLSPALANVLAEGEEEEEQWAKEGAEYVWEADREDVEGAGYKDELESPFGGIGGSAIMAVRWNKPDAAFGHLPRIDLALSTLPGGDVFLSEMTPAIEWFRNIPLAADSKYPAALVLTSESQHCETIIETLTALRAYIPIDVFMTGRPSDACVRHVTADICDRFPACCSPDFESHARRLMPMAGWMAKEHMQEACVAYYHKFTLVIEEEPWTYGFTSGRLWQTLAAGTVPVYSGSRSVSAHLPAQSSVVKVRDFETYDVLGRHLVQLLTNTAQYEALLAWRSRPFREAFLRDAESACTSAVCSIIANLDLEEE